MRMHRWMLALIAVAPGSSACRKAPPEQTPVGVEAPEKAAPAVLTMSPEALRAAGIVTSRVAQTTITVRDEMPGTIEAPSDALVIINTPASGVVEALEVDVGDRVTAGMRLATIRSPELSRAQGEYEHSVIAEQHANAALKRSEALEAEGLLSRRRLEADRLQWQASQLAVEEASQHIKILRGSLKDSSGSITITSPIAGTVATRTVNRGEALAENAPLFSVVNVSKVIVQLRSPTGVPVTPGTQVAFAVEGLAGRTFSATVKSAADIVDPETRRFFIRCAVDNRDNLLKPGMFVTASVPRAKVTALAVPEASVQIMEGQPSVFVAREGGRFERRPVVLGVRSDGYVALESGLAEGESVVTEGSFWVRSQMQKSELEE